MLQNSESVELSIVIINFRTLEYMQNCLSSLLPEIEELDAKVVIVDNNSNDGSAEQIKAWLEVNDKNSKTLFIQSEHNGGFASGNNIGIRAVSAENYLLLNSDTLIRKDAIKVMLDTMKTSKSAGLVSPRLEWPDGEGQESCFNYPGPLSEFMLAAQTGIFDRIFKRFTISLPLQSSIAHPDWTSFACILVNKKVIEQVGLLDEGYFMYFEDIEYCMRSRKAGWDIVHNPEARVVHLRGGSSPVKSLAQLNKRLPRYYYESRTRYLYQSYGYLGLFFVNVMWLFGRVISGIRQIFGDKQKTVSKRQWLDIWINSFKPLNRYTHPES